jgi:hypothetical protein
VVLKAREDSRGACRPGASNDTFSLRVQMVDDDGDVILDETRSNLTCDRRVGQEEFEATYGVKNCSGSVAPAAGSSGTVMVTATTDDGQLVANRTIHCQK